MTIGKRRAAVVLIEGGRVALIRRVRSDRTYFLFPGGGVEGDETLPAAARREALEELGLDVAVEELICQVEFGASSQFYFMARRVGGRFGAGKGKEMKSPVTSKAGSYRAIWVPIGELRSLDVRPEVVVEHLLTPDPTSN